MKIKVVICIIYMFLLISPQALANDGYNDSFKDSVELKDSLLSDDANLNEPGSLMEDLTPKKIWGFFLEQFKNGFSGALKNLMIGLSLVMMSVLISRCGTNLQNQSFQLLFSFVISVSMVMICQSGLSECSKALQKAVEDMKVFTSACIPSFSVVMLAAGEGGGASVFSASMVLLGELGTLVSDHLLLPLTDVYLSIGICAVISDEYNFSALAKNVRRFVIWLIGLAMILFRMIMRLQSAAAAAGDRLTQKTIRAAVGGMIPIVGNTLSQGVDGLFTAASGVKISFAIAAVLIILSIMAPVLIQIGVYGLSWSICRWVADFMNDITVRSIAEVLSNCFYMMLAIGSFVALMGLFAFFGIMIQVN